MCPHGTEEGFEFPGTVVRDNCPLQQHQVFLTAKTISQALSSASLVMQNHTAEVTDEGKGGVKDITDQQYKAIRRYIP